MQPPSGPHKELLQEAQALEDGVSKIIALVRGRIPNAFGLDPISDIQVLCPMNRGGLGVRSLNIELQKALNTPGEARIERFGWTFCLGERSCRSRTIATSTTATLVSCAGSISRRVSLLYKGMTRGKRLVVLVGQR